MKKYEQFLFWGWVYVTRLISFLPLGLFMGLFTTVLATLFNWLLLKIAKKIIRGRIKNYTTLHNYKKYGLDLELVPMGWGIVNLFIDNWKWGKGMSLKDSIMSTLPGGIFSLLVALPITILTFFMFLPYNFWKIYVEYNDPRNPFSLFNIVARQYLWNTDTLVVAFSPKGPFDDLNKIQY